MPPHEPHLSSHLCQLPLTREGITPISSPFPIIPSRCCLPVFRTKTPHKGIFDGPPRSRNGPWQPRSLLAIYYPAARPHMDIRRVHRALTISPAFSVLFQNQFWSGSLLLLAYAWRSPVSSFFSFGHFSFLLSWSPARSRPFCQTDCLCAVFRHCRISIIPTVALPFKVPIVAC